MTIGHSIGVQRMVGWLCRFALGFTCGAAIGAAPAANAIELTGVRTVSLVSKTGEKIPIGKVEFTAQSDGKSNFKLDVDHGKFKDFFLSMKEFKCLDGGVEIMCHVGYPYKSPKLIASNDFAWLEHSLLFMYKQPKDFGAMLWNGIYFEFSNTPTALIGKPQSIDLNRISAPPTSAAPPYGKANRDDIPAGARWIEKLVIE